MPTPDLTAADVIRLLELEPLPVEGGYFRPTYRGPLQLPTALLPPGSTLERSITSAIYYLLTADTISRLHRLPTDEMWHFYMGDPVGLHIFQPYVDYTKFYLGHDLVQGQTVQAVVPAHSWFGARLLVGEQEGQPPVFHSGLRPSTGWALMACTLAPAYSDEDFSLPDPAEFAALLARFPAQQEILNDLR